jgi:hypothetical protein
MIWPKCGRHDVSKLPKSAVLGIASLLLLFDSGLGRAGPPNPTASDSLSNTAGGTSALINTAHGGLNTAFGFNALTTNSGGSSNSAFGSYTLRANTEGVNNSAFGYDTLRDNTTGARNSAFGNQALNVNTTGADNSAFGYEALFSNTTGDHNSAFGDLALEKNTTGSLNTAFGGSALLANTSGTSNTASGYLALQANTEGNSNTAFGYVSLVSNKGGTENTALGAFALATSVHGNYNTAIGYDADIAASAGHIENSTALGYQAIIHASNSIVLGNDKITKIHAQVTSISSISDRRRKKDITPLDTGLGLDFIEKLQPVSYRFNNGDETERYGFIAQDLEQALPVSLHAVERSEPEHDLALIERQDDEDHTYRLSYGELFAPIVKAVQQQQQEIEAERQKNADLRRALEEQAAAFKAETEALRHSITALRDEVIAAR